MLYNSYSFLFFLALMLPAYYLALTRLGRPTGMLVLAFGSLFFYGWWKIDYVLILLISVSANFLLGRRLIAEQDGGRPAWARRLLMLGVAGNLGALAYYKYAGLLTELLAAVIDRELTIPGIVLPLAISFFTFQQIAYLVDLYRGERPGYAFVDYLVFVTFFPQLIAGPIVHHREMMPQFSSGRLSRSRAEDFAVGLSLFSIGLAKKVLLADNLAPMADASFRLAEMGTEQAAVTAWMGAGAYCLQIYFDFSGYSDMATGLARLFGIRLPVNFYSPYKAHNIIQFWQRWHVTLSRFLRDYVYISLGGNRRGKLRRYRNLLITMLLGGLWHGAGVNFVLWGGLHGIYLCINHLWREWRARMPSRAGTARPMLSQLASQLLTLAAVIIAWVFFRAQTYQGATLFLDCMFTGGLTGDLTTFYRAHLTEFDRLLGEVSGYNQSFAELAQLRFYKDLLCISLASLICLCLPNSLELFGKFNPAVDFSERSAALKPTASAGRIRYQWHTGVGWSLFCGALLVLSLLQFTQLTPFLYFQF